tara:strand:+ start:1213 stop:1590 length:378 start_codon:yes stop_codon:yes gene_type:complete
MQDTRETYDTDNSKFNYSSTRGYVEIDITKYPADKVVVEKYTDKNGQEQVAVKLKMIYTPCDNPQVRKSATHSLLPNISKEEADQRRKDDKLLPFCGNLTELKATSTSAKLPEGTDISKYIGINS